MFLIVTSRDRSNHTQSASIRQLGSIGKYSIPANFARRSDAVSRTRSAFFPPRSITKKLTVPAVTRVAGIAPASRNVAVNTCSPSTRTSSAGFNVIATTPRSFNTIVPKCAGTFFKTMALSGAEPTEFDPGARKCSPTNVSQPSSRNNRSTRAARPFSI